MIWASIGNAARKAFGGAGRHIETMFGHGGKAVAKAKIGAQAGVEGSQIAYEKMRRWGGPKAQGAWNWAKTPSKSRTAAVIGGLGAIGYGTSDAEDPLQRIGRGVAFAGGGVYLNKRIFNNPALGKAAKDLKKAYSGDRFSLLNKGNNQRYLYGPFNKGGKGRLIIGADGKAGGVRQLPDGVFDRARNLAKKRARSDFGGAIGMPKRWGVQHSMVAGAYLGLASDETSVAEGALGGGIFHGGVKGLKKLGWSKFKAPFRRGDVGLQNRMTELSRLPLIRAGAGIGMLKGAYDEFGTGSGAPGVLGGALMGAAKGAALGVGVKAVARAPMVSLTAGMAGMTVAGAAVEGFRTIEQSETPYNLHADGEFALALHSLRHGR